MDFNETTQAVAEIRQTISRIERSLQNVPQTILNRIYDSIGFNQVDDAILRNLVIARVCQPQSKVATVEYLKSSQQEIIQCISVEHTMMTLGGRIGLVFYDVTTLYFESTPGEEDDMRQNGFSKDGKTAGAQIVLGLLVSEDGCPLSSSIFNGKQYEGYTMIPIIGDFVQRFSLTDFVVVADSGLMSSRNIQLLQEAGYKYILGARIRNEAPAVKQWILSIEKEAGNVVECRKENG